MHDVSMPVADGAMPSMTTSVSWPKTLAVIAGSLGLLLVLFSSTVASALHQWNTSSAYNYGYLIAPISLYLIWSERAALAVWRPRASAWGIVLCAAFALAWLMADIVGIDEGRQVALVGMMQGVFLGVLGWPLYRRLAFPLLYLWLQVPTGEFLLAPLQSLTHTVAVWMLKLSGMPVFGEGMLIQVPSGNFLVEPGCAGLNFLLASIALALLYGKLTYRRWSARLICLAAAIVGSILANFVRVYLIVAVTEWTDRRIDITDDHLFYGWVFFGIIMMAMMWFGMRYKDTDDVRLPADERPSHRSSRTAAPLAAMAAGCIVVAGAAAAVSDATATTADADEAVVRLPPEIGGWSRFGVMGDWRPLVADEATLSVMTYVQAGRRVDVAIGYFAAQVDEAEAASPANRPGQPDVWQEAGRSTVQVDSPAGPRVVNRVDLRGAAGTRAAYYWYVSSGCVTPRRIVAKLCILKDRLRVRPSPGAVVTVSVPVTPDQDDSGVLLSDFVAAFDNLEALVRNPAGAPD